MSFVNRDVFARTELHRETVRKPAQRMCGWCGVPTYMMPHDRLFRYYTETDDGRRHTHKGLFCCKSCHDAYYS